MEQMTIDDIPTKRFPNQRDVGFKFKINGNPMEIIISNASMMVIYDIRKEKIHPLRFVE